LNAATCGNVNAVYPLLHSLVVELFVPQQIDRLSRMIKEFKVSQAMSEATSHLEEQQIEKLEQIGTYLRQVREQQELSLEQISTTTMVQARLLRAIENAQLKDLPEPVYIQGFLKRYANALGLDGEAVGQAFPVRNDSTLYQKSWQEMPASQLRPLHLYVAYILLIGAAIAGLSYVLTRNPESVVTLPSPSVPSPAVSPPPIAAPSPAASPVSSPVAQEKPVQVDVTLREQSWMRVEVDGETVFEGMLAEGIQRTWSGEQEVIIRAGNAGGVMVAYNQAEAQPMGDRGTVQQAIFTANAPSPLDES